MSNTIELSTGEHIDLAQDQDKNVLAKLILANGLKTIDDLQTLEKNLLFDHPAVQVARDLKQANLLTKGCALEDSIHFCHDPQQNIGERIQENKSLFKMIDPKNWDDFMRQLTDYQYRPKLRAPHKSKTHKFMHDSKQIVLYEVSEVIELSTVVLSKKHKKPCQELL